MFSVRISLENVRIFFIGKLPSHWVLFVFFFGGQMYSSIKKTSDRLSKKTDSISKKNGYTTVFFFFEKSVGVSKKATSYFLPFKFASKTKKSSVSRLQFSEILFSEDKFGCLSLILITEFNFFDDGVVVSIASSVGRFYC
jgi:hypothetical protein